MIFTERTIRVTNGASQINSPIVLYKGDKNIKIRFKIMDCPYTYSKNVDNIIEVSEASYAQLVIKTPNDELPIFSDIAETESGYVTFTITGEMIDEAKEVGKYSFQVRLLDDEKFSRITIPEVVDGIDVRDPIAIEDISPTNEVDIATVGYALTTAATPEDTFNSEGNYNKTTWRTGDRITAAKLNKIEAGIDGVNQKIASGGTSGEGMTQEQVSQLSTAYQHSQAIHAPSNAEANVQADWNETNTASDAYIKNKPTNLATTDDIPAVPTKTSQLTNDSGYITNIPDEYITETELNAKGYATTAQIPTVPTNVSEFTNDANYASETFVTNKIAEASLSGGEVDLSGYVTKETGNANQITFADGQTFQAKLEAGTLKGDKGDKGDKGEQGPQGPQGDPGTSNIDDITASITTTYSSNKIENIKENLSSQIKEIENNGVSTETVEAKVQSVIDEKIADGSLGSLTVGAKSIGIEQFRDELISAEVSGVIVSGSSAVSGGSLAPVYSINNEYGLFSSNEQVTISFKIFPKDVTKITSVFVYVLQGSTPDSNADESIMTASPIIPFSEGTYLYSFNCTLGTLSQNYVKIMPCIKYNSIEGNDTYIWDVTITSSTNTVTPDYSYPYRDTVKVEAFSGGLPFRLLQANSVINWEQLAGEAPASIVNKVLTDGCIRYTHLGEELVGTSYNWIISSKQCNLDSFTSRAAGFSVDTSNFTLNENVTFEFEAEFEAGYFTAVGHWLMFSDNKDDTTSFTVSNQQSLTDITDTDTLIKYSKTITITNINKPYCQFYIRLKGLNDNLLKTFNIRKVKIIKSDGTIIKPMFSCFYNPIAQEGIVTTLENTVDQIATFKHIYRLEKNINALQDEINSFNVLMPYKGKTIATFGDSIEQGTFSNGRWQSTTKEILKCNIINRGNSGGDIERMWRIVQGETISGTPDPLDDWSQIDVVTMKIGTNSGGIRVGSLEDYVLSEGQTYLDYPNTYYGYYGKCIEYIWEQNPKIKIILMTPPMVDTARTSWVKPLADTTIREIAKHYGVGLIDIYYESGLSDKNFWWSEDEVHPTKEGNKVLGDFIARKLLTF